MNRKSATLSILIAVFVGLFASLNPVNAATSQETHNVFVTNFESGMFIGAVLNLDGDSYDGAIKFNLIGDEITQEDMIPSYGSMITATFDIDSDRGMTGIMHVYSSEYNRMLDMAFMPYTDDDHIVGYVKEYDDYSTGTMDGQWSQFGGFVHNGSIIKLRGADAYSVKGMGWLLQDSYLISYTVSNDEPYNPPTVVYVPLVSN